MGFAVTTRFRKPGGIGRAIRDQHRGALISHAFVMMTGLLTCAAINRLATPEHLWVQWVALCWAAAFAIHLWIFSRNTLDSMTSRGRALRALRRP
jgi:hypothetical protein